jgi:hypothetical protein
MHTNYVICSWNDLIIWTIYLVCQPLNTSPSAHDEWVVCSDDSDDIDTLGFELVVIGKVGREVVDVTSWLTGWGKFNDQTARENAYSESTRYRKEHDLLALPTVSRELGGL